MNDVFALVCLDRWQAPANQVAEPIRLVDPPRTETRLMTGDSGILTLLVELPSRQI